MSIFPPHFRFLTLAILAFVFASQEEGLAQFGENHVEAALVTEYEAVVPGQDFVVGVKLKIDPKWHTYWINPGGPGYPPKVDWELPEGFVADALQFPYPHQFETAGLIGFGYETEVIHPVIIRASEKIKPGDSITLKAKVNWLMCDDQTCVPGSANLSIDLQVAEEKGAETTDAAAIEASRQALPVAPEGWQSGYEVKDGQVVVTIAVGKALKLIPEGLVIYPEVKKIIKLGEKAEVDLKDGVLTIRVAADDPVAESLPPTFRAVLHAEEEIGGHQAIQIIAKLGLVPEYGAPVVSSLEPTESTVVGEEASRSLISVLIGIFFGGLILNVMPCVFPVISLKIMSFVEQAGESRKRVLAHGLVFTSGILVFFWALVAALMILRAGGEKVGWGFQMQSPIFVMGMIVVMFVLSLSLFGVFEFGTSMTGVGGKLSMAKGYRGSFWSGALAVLLATPCAGPLLGPLIGYAISQTPAMSFMIFTSMALGMASPYIVLSAVPKLLDYVPRPGAWMETFRNLMGFPMLIAVVWLVWVLGAHVGNNSLSLFLGSLVVIAAALWLYGKYLALGAVGGKHPVIWAIVLGLFVSSLTLSVLSYQYREKSDGDDIAAIIRSHRESGRAVFVDFTAKWCLVCQANKPAMHSDEVQAAFKEKNVVFVIADWTKPNPHIADYLEKYGRASVPFYPLFPADPDKEPIILPQNLTKGIILEYLDKL